MNVFNIIGCVTGILGFIISLINLVYFFLIRRKKLNIRFGIMSVSHYHTSNNLLKIQYSFENKSQLTISITRIQVLVNGKLYDCERLPVIIEQVTRKQGNQVYDCDFIKSNSVPINLLPLAAESGFFAFAIPKDTLSNFDKALIFRICTNRGRAIQKTFVLHEDNLIC